MPGETASVAGYHVCRIMQRLLVNFAITFVILANLTTSDWHWHWRGLSHGHT